MISPYRKYSLAKGNKKFTCPACGRPKCFKPYVDNETGEVLHEMVGRCDHEQSCQFHYPPYKFFQDNPEARRTKSDLLSKILSSPKSITKVLTEQQQTKFFPMEWVETGTMRESTFSRWFRSLPFDEGTKADVLKEYYVGATRDDIVIQGTNYGPAAVFWMIDENQRPHDAKLMAYTCDGHRVSDWGNSMRAISIRKRVGPQLDSTDKTLFGLHLLPRYPEKDVCIVESEKSALICACKYPQYLWLATGGCGGLNEAKIRPLMNRHLIIYPDSGEYDKWQMRMQATRHPHYRIEDFMEQYPPNTDIADLILDHLATQ